MSTLIETLLATVKPALEDGHRVRVAMGKNGRVYVNGLGKDIVAYWDWPDGDAEDKADADGHPLDGARFRVFTNANGVTNKWKAKRTAQIVKDVVERLIECGVEFHINV